MPSTTVRGAPTVMAIVEAIEGVSTTTTSSSPVGSVKYMSTMSRK